MQISSTEKTFVSSLKKKLSKADNPNIIASSKGMRQHRFKK